MKNFKGLISAVIILVTMILSFAVTAYADNRQYEYGDTCHTMTKKWFGEETELFSSSSEELLIKEYFAIREKSLTDNANAVTSILSKDVLEIENQRRNNLVNMQQKMRIKITDAESHVSIGNATVDNGVFTAEVREWVFYDYDDLDVAGVGLNVAGFGVEHIVKVKDGVIIADEYDESDMTGICTAKVEEDDFLLMEDNNSEDTSTLMGSFYASYDPSAAAAYADKYALNYNTAYTNFNSVGGDCANFTSQSIYAGGMPQVVGTAYGTDGWYYKTSSNRSATWTGASQLRTWMANNRGKLINSPSASQIYKGSPVFYDWYNDGSYDHATICVGTNSEGVPIIDSHNKDYYHQKWNYGYAATVYSTVQLTASNPESSATTPVIYYVSYDPNGGSGSMGVQAALYGQGDTITISNNAFTKTGYKFKHWQAPSYPGSTIYKVYYPGDTVVDLSSTHGAIITMYAVWEPVVYNVKFNANGGTGSTPTANVAYGFEFNLPANEFTRDGYTFLGWSKSSTATSATYSNKALVKNLASTDGATVTLYAVWEKDEEETYIIKYAGNGATGGSTASSVHTYGVPKALTKNGFVKTGYRFSGWYQSGKMQNTFQDQEVVQDLKNSVGTDTTVTLVAMWSANSYTVQYNANGGSGTTAISNHVYAIEKALTANGFTRNGYTFLGWSLSPSATSADYADQENVTNLTDIHGDVVTLYAVWEKDVVSVTGVTLNQSEVNLELGDTIKLLASVTPYDATDKTVVWQSSNTSVVTVENGVISTKGLGTAIITVRTIDGNKTASCVVRVSKPYVSVTGVRLNTYEETLYTGESVKLVATVIPSDATDKTIFWESSDETVATVVDGVVTAVGTGEATIKVTTDIGFFSALCTIYVEEPYVSVTGVRLNTYEETLYTGESVKLVATVIPSDATDKTIFWESSDETVATVVDGVVTAVRAGEATIKVTTDIGFFSASCTVYVEEKATEVARAKLKIGEVKGRANENVTLPIAISENPGIAGFKIKIGYDNRVLTPVSIAKGSALTSGTLTSNLDQGGDLTRLTYVSAFWSNPSNVTANGEILLVTFAVKESAEAGIYPVTVTYETGEVTNQNYEDIGLDITDGSVEITDVVIGDVFYDGKVNTKDSVRLSQYLADWEIEFTSYEKAAADILADGKINTKDSVKLSQYLADWDVELTELFALGSITFSAGDAEVIDGYVDVPVTITENSGVAGFKVKIGYDKSLLTPVSVTKGDALSGGTMTTNLDNGGDFSNLKAVSVFWSNPSNMSKTGTAFTVRFKVAEGLEGSTPITLSYEEGDICDQSYNDLAVTLENGQVLKKEEISYDYTVNSLLGTVKDGKFYAEAEIVKNTDRDSKDMIVIAVYKDDVMVDMVYMKANFNMGQTVSFGGILDGSEGAVLKAFVWDSLTGMNALSNVIEK